jgi:uncharacterized protein (TIGR02391 family)
MERAIPKLRKRISELQEFDVESIQERGDPKIIALETKLNNTLEEIFGDSNQCLVFRYNYLDTAPERIGEGYRGKSVPLNIVIAGYRKGIDNAVINTESIIEYFEEEIEDFRETPSERALKAFGELELHPEIEQAVSKLFQDGHYSDAVFNACKVLDKLVQDRSRITDLSGTDLMNKVFSSKKPFLRFNDLQNSNERNEQEGMMFLYSGAMKVIRNPRAHNIIEDNPESAFEHIVFLSFLAKTLDKTKSHYIELEENKNYFRM